MNIKYRLGTGVTAVCLHPGAVRTQITRYVQFTIFRYFPQMIHIFYIFYVLITKSAREGAMTTIHCAVSEEITKYNGFYFRFYYYLLNLFV